MDRFVSNSWLMTTTFSIYTELSKNSEDQEIALNNAHLSVNPNVLPGQGFI